MEAKNYPNRVCRECGLKASGGRAFALSTFHKNICDVCGEEKHVTEPRDFYYPRFVGFKGSDLDEPTEEELLKYREIVSGANPLLTGSGCGETATGKGFK